MAFILETHAIRTAFAVLALAAGLILNPAAHAQTPPAQATHAASPAGMPVAQQNALVQKYCEVCHDDAYMNGGISFQHFDAANADPGDAAMMLAKLQTGAIGASGKPEPDKATIAAWIAATAAEISGANRWIVSQGQDPSTKAPVSRASILQTISSPATPAQPDLWRLTVTCSANTHEGEIKLLWSPGGPGPDQVMVAAIDGEGEFKFRADGTERMGNGGTSGPGSLVLFATAPKFGMALPANTLTMSNLVNNETVAFPFADLSPSARQALAPCFTGSGPGTLTTSGN
jgi:hypothetical protein